MPSRRVVSLLPSATEVVCALGLGDHLVGRSHECDYPADVRQLPICTSSRLPRDADSPALDRTMRSIVQNALSIYQVDAEALRQLRPDLVITQTQCEVCAVSPREVEAVLADWLGDRPEIVALQPDDLAAVGRDIQRIADALQAPAAGRVLNTNLKRRMQKIAVQATKLQSRPRLLCVEWIEPLMGAGNWMPELVAMAGGEALFGTAGQHSPWLDWRDVVSANPDVILVHACGWSIARASADMHYLSQRPEWSGLRAVRHGRVYIADGNQYFNRPGPRLAESLEILAEILHPGSLAFGHQGSSWIRWC